MRGHTEARWTSGPGVRRSRPRRSRAQAGKVSALCPQVQRVQKGFVMLHGHSVSAGAVPHPTESAWETKLAEKS